MYIYIGCISTQYLKVPSYIVILVLPFAASSHLTMIYTYEVTLRPWSWESMRLYMGCALLSFCYPTTANVKISSTACVKIAFCVMVAISPIHRRVDGIIRKVFFPFFSIFHGVIFMLHLHAEYAALFDWMSWSDFKSWLIIFSFSLSDMMSFASSSSFFFVINFSDHFRYNK